MSIRLYYCNLLLKFVLPSIVSNFRGFGHSHLIKDNILSEKTKNSFVKENQKNRKKEMI